MIGKKLRPVSRKMWQFHSNMNIEDTLWKFPEVESYIKIGHAIPYI